jgi:hypothetical protein
MNNIFSDADVISTYSRADAITDRVLVDLSILFPISRRLYKFPIACTSTVWNIISSTGNENLIGEVVAVLVASQRNITKQIDDACHLFGVVLEGAAPTERCTFKIMCHGGDNCEPVLTIMLPTED